MAYEMLAIVHLTLPLRYYSHTFWTAMTTVQTLNTYRRLAGKCHV